MLLSKLVTRMGINIPGTGIALTIPIASIGGSSSVKYLTEGQEKASTGDVKMIEHNYSLITVIAEKGYSDMVMDAARAPVPPAELSCAARAPALSLTAKYFGVSIAAEKEFIYIVAKNPKFLYFRMAGFFEIPVLRPGSIRFVSPVTLLCCRTGVSILSVFLFTGPIPMEQKSRCMRLFRLHTAGFDFNSLGNSFPKTYQRFTTSLYRPS